MKTTVRACASAVFFTFILTIVAGPAAAWWIRDCDYTSSFSGQTSRVADVNPGAPDAVDILFGFSEHNEFLGSFQGKVYFQADDGQSGAELWKVDGSAAVQVQDLAPGAAGSSPHSFVEFQNKLYFAATTPGTGEELFSYDGTTISVAAQAAPGAAGGEIRALTEYNGALYFTRRTDADGQRVWRFSGGMVQLVAALNSASGSVDDGVLTKAPFVVFGGKLWHVRVTPLPERYELWSFDGTSATKVKALSAGLSDFDDITEREFQLGVYQGALYFGVVAPGSPPFVKDELWRVGAQGSPTKIADLPGNAYSYSQPSDFAVYHGKLYFGGAHFYRYDGSTVQQLSPGIFGVGQMTPFAKADRLFLAGFAADWTSDEPYLYDGNGVTLVQNIMPDTADPYPGSFPTSGVEADAFYFFAADQDHGRELWQIKGEATWTLQCDIVVAPIWVDKRLWVIREPEVLVANWVIEPDTGARQVSRQVVRVERGKEVRVTAFQRDTRRQPMPEAFGLVTMVFDRAHGALLEAGFEVVGDATPRAAEALHRAAAGVMAKRSLKEVEAETASKY
jgi:ELWxxDGT repeat protein